LIAGAGEALAISLRHHKALQRDIFNRTALVRSTSQTFPIV
jgi:hypothetical protein